MIQLTNISKNFAKQELFNKLNFKLNAGTRVGLVGRNGSGKSTLFKLILGEETADSGDIIIPKNCIKSPANNFILINDQCPHRNIF